MPTRDYSRRVRGDPLILKTTISSSDYGYGAICVKFAFDRLWCVNGAIGNTIFEKRHIGAGNWQVLEGFIVSPRAERLFERAELAALEDAVAYAFSKDVRTRLLESYEQAAAKTIDVEEEVDALYADGAIKKDDRELVTRMVLGNQQVEVLPQTESPNSLLRLAQCVSWLAHQETNPEDQIAMEEAAASLMPKLDLRQFKFSKN